MNIGFKIAFTFAILTIFFGVIGQIQQTTFFKGWWIAFAWLTFIAVVIGAIQKIWEK